IPGTVVPATLTINHDRQFLITQPNATMAPQGDVGFYAHDTRFVSGYSVTINGLKPLLLDAITVEHFSARHEFMTPELRLGPGSGADADGVLPEGSVGFRMERTILEGVHEDYDLTNHAMHPVRLVLEIGIESDCAGVFDVRGHRLIRRGDLQTTWRPRMGELRSNYHNRTFRRGLIVKVEKAGSKPEYTLYPKIKVTQEEIPTNFEDKIKTEMSANNEPDAMYVSTSLMNFAAPAGRLLDLTPLMSKWGVSADEYIPTLMTPWQLNGKQYALPKDFGDLILFYNKSLFSSAGLATPTSWDDIKAAAKTLTKGGVKGISLPADAARFDAFLFGYGGSGLPGGQAKGGLRDE